MLNQVILIEETKFINKLISSLLQDNEVQCYCLDQIEDFSYLLEDLTPQILLVNCNIASSHWDIFAQSVINSKYQGFKKILYGDVEEIHSFEMCDFFDDTLPKPLDIMNLFDYLNSQVNSH